MPEPITNTTTDAPAMSYKGMTLDFLESASFWANIAVAVFGTLAAVAGLFALYFSNALGAAKDADLAKFREQAEITIASANARAAEANAKAAEAGTGSAKALADAAAASERAGRLELDAAAQRERAAKAEKDLLALQQQVAPRRIAKDKVPALTEALRRAPSKGPIDLVCVLGDAEGIAFASQIDEILKSAGWPSKGVSQGIYTPANPVGFGLVVREGRTAPPYAIALQKAFDSVGLPLAAVENRELDAGIVQLLIGNKPK